MSMVRYLVGDVFERLAQLEDGSIDMAMTSPPFIGLREYLPLDHPLKAFEIGLEPTPAEFITTMLELCALIRQKMARTGSIVIELGDTYSESGGAGGDYNSEGWRANQPKPRGSSRLTPRMRPDMERFDRPGSGQLRTKADVPTPRPVGNGGNGWPLSKSKALIPELLRVALAYGIHPLTGEQSPAGLWRVRNVVTWVRTNPAPGALADKFRGATSDLVIACTAEDRWFDEVTCRVPASPNTNPRTSKTIDVVDETGKSAAPERGGNFKTLRRMHTTGKTAPLLDWWEISAAGYNGAHYAVYPPELCHVPIQTMCPRQVCTVCGEPRRPIVETISALGVGAARGAHREGAMGRHRDDCLDQNDPAVPNHADKVIAGWTHCECHQDHGCRPTVFEHRKVPMVDEEGEPMMKNGKPRTRRERVVIDPGWCNEMDANGHPHHRNGVVLDPFGGSGTTGMVASGLGRDAVLIDLDSRNADLARQRIGMFLTVEE